MAIAMQLSVFGYIATNCFEINSTIGIIISTLIITLYCYTGGVKAVITTDAIQLLIVVTLLPLLGYAAVANFGGAELLVNKISALPVSNDMLEMDNTKYWLLAFICLIPSFYPAEFHRLIIAKTPSKIKLSLSVAAIIGLGCYTVIGILTAIAYASNQNLAGNQVLLYSIHEFIPSELVIAAYLTVIAVVMSTIDSYLNTASVTIVHDIIEPIFGKLKSAANKIEAARRCTLIISVVSCALALGSESVMSLVQDLIYLWFAHLCGTDVCLFI